MKTAGLLSKVASQVLATAARTDLSSGHSTDNGWCHAERLARGKEKAGGWGWGLGLETRARSKQPLLELSSTSVPFRKDGVHK